MNSLAKLSSRLRGFLADYFLILGSARKKLRGIVLMMFGLVGLDLVGVGLIVPFVALFSASDEQSWLPLLSTDPRVAFLLLGLILLAVFALKALFGHWLLLRIQLFTERFRADLIRRLLSAYQAQGWSYYLERNTAEMSSRMLWNTEAYAAGTLAASLHMATNGLVCAALFVLLAVTDITSVALLALIFGTVFLWVYILVRPRLRHLTKVSSVQHRKLARGTKQALEGFREIRLLGTEAHFRDVVGNAASELGHAAAHRAALSMVPRYSFEVAMVAGLVAIGATRAWLDGSTAQSMPVIGMFAAAGMRILPASTALLNSVNQIRAHRFALGELANELQVLGASKVLAAEAAPTASDPFEVLELRNVTFKYPTAAAPVLREVSLTIRAGESVGLMGKSGAGKSTLADLILGFLEPQSGELLVNGRGVHADLRGWLRCATYIPQRVFLIDDTLRANIEFGAPPMPDGEQRLKEAIEQSQLADLVARLPQGLDTRIGEAGVRLSGGQRQRVALARALFHERDFIVLDEATSALDQETEDAVVQAVFGLAGRKTLFVIAHRESTLAGCGTRLFLEDGRLSRLDASEGEPSPEAKVSARRHGS